jgi:hypothetical protein
VFLCGLEYIFFQYIGGKTPRTYRYSHLAASSEEQPRRTYVGYKSASHEAPNTTATHITGGIRKVIKDNKRCDQPHNGESMDSHKSALAVTKTAIKKPFVEPEISVPVDVLEATTFFQAVSSGATN